jgi:alkylhydroperoxidase family enzyme
MALAPSFALLFVTVELEHRAVDADLIAGVVSDEHGCDFRLSRWRPPLRALPR